MSSYRIERAVIVDASSILELQKLCYQQEAELYKKVTLVPLTQTLENIEGEFTHKVFLKASHERKIVGSVRAFLSEGSCYIGRLIVHPDHQGQGLGTSLMKHIEGHFRDKRYELFTGHKSEANLRLYKRLGYRTCGEKTLPDDLTLIGLEKLAVGLS